MRYNLTSAEDKLSMLLILIGQSGINKTWLINMM